MADLLRENIACSTTVNKNSHLDSVRADSITPFLQVKVVSGDIFGPFWATKFDAAMIAPRA